MSLVYVTPVLGGIIADHYIGYRRAIFLGGILMALGHFFLTIELPVFFYGSLALIIVGNGFFKPNISTFVGELYEEGDKRRDAGFTIFYMGINIGGAVAPLLCAWFAEVYGWHYGFMLAGLGMLLGLFYFYRGTNKNVFQNKGKIPNIELFQKKFLGLNKGQLVILSAFLAVPIFALIVRFNQYEHYIVWVATFAITGMLIYIYRSVGSIARKRLLVTAYFTILMTLFWAIFEQAGSSLTLFADRNINLVGLNAAQTNSINSGFIILLAIPFSWLWTVLIRKKKNPNSAIKAGLGLLLLGLGFIVFAMSANSADAFAKTPMWYLFVGYFILTVGELCISPIGLSKMTELSPKKYLAFIMGVFFSASFYGHFFAGKIAKLTTVSDGENPFAKGILGQITEMVTGLTSTFSGPNQAAFEQLYQYVSVYAVFGVLTAIIGVVVMLISPFIKKLMSGVH
jgi:POT family proton-dependent oligopeptide transporter